MVFLYLDFGGGHEKSAIMIVDIADDVSSNMVDIADVAYQTWGSGYQPKSGWIKTRKRLMNFRSGDLEGIR